MPSIKIYPPSRLPDTNVTETQFSMWKEELEVYLSQEPDYKLFLPEKRYSTWLSQEENPVRIIDLDNNDLVHAVVDERTQAEADTQNEDKLDSLRINLRTVLSIVGKCVSEGHYNSVIRHSTSLTWIFDMLRRDYDIQSKGVHFFNILDTKYDATKTTPITFYNLYRTMIANNLAKAGDIIKYKNNEKLTQDERFSPMLEDIVLLDVLKEIDSRLPSFVRSHYFHKMKKEERLMDFKTDILVNVPHFIDQLDNTAEPSSLNAFKQGQYAPRPNRKAKKSAQTSTKYCHFCFLHKMPKEMFTNHTFGDPRCSISSKDRKAFMEFAKLSLIKDEAADEDPEVDEEELAQMYGYGGGAKDESEEVHQVNQETFSSQSIQHLSRNEDSKCGYIQPVPSQILTVFQDLQNKNPFHIDLDSGATVSFIRKSEAIRHNFTIYPNGQMSKLGDGVTKLKGIGEINVTFFRNKIPIKYQAVVCDNLTSPAIGGTPFFKENGIEQDFSRNVIHLRHRQVTVQPTDPISLLPTAPLLSSSSKVTNDSSSKLLSFKSRILLPDQEVSLKVEHEESSIVSIEPWERNKNSDWPEPELKQVTNGKIKLCNSSNKPIMLGKDVKFCKIRNTHNPVIQPPSYYKYSQTAEAKANENEENLSVINLENINCDKAKEIIENCHSKFHEVFNKDLTGGYNGYFGKHECRLNWASSERPVANKVRVPNYDHDLKGVQQDLMDELTDQGVLLVPQDHNIKVQSVCPSFIQRKQRAKNKPKQALTKDDVRLLVNFGPINEKIKPPPIHVPKTNDILITLGRWKHLIIFDLFNGYYQNHMSSDAIPWLGLQTPFGGLRVMCRSGQGLAGMAEEFDELTAKILKQEMQDGVCVKIVDDCYVGGQTQEEAAINYARVIKKFAEANIKVSPSKTHIFPKQADVLGWVWKVGGHLEASEHRKLALTNTKIENIKTVKDMRSWIGLFKTLHIVTPNISKILSPFENETAGKESRETFEWNYNLEKKFREAKESIDKLVTLYLPSPNDQLILQTDACQVGIGHVLFAVKNGKKLPVRIHSVKLPERCKKWSPCELESLALAAGVDKEYDIIRESKLPLIIETDSKPVHEALKLIKDGKFSASARMSSFLTNVNRTSIDSKHISGKARLNPLSDLQSRSPPDCNSETCSIHKFIEEKIDSIIDEGAKNCSIAAEPTGFTNREAWKNAQKSNQACNEAKKLLSSGKPPPKAIGKYSGEYWNDIRHYFRDVTIAKDGLLIVKSKPETVSGNVIRERIVIPKPLVPALLYHIHNHQDLHPSKSQQKAIFQRQFYAISLDKHLDLLYNNCYKCSVIIKLPKEIIPNESKTMVDGPQTHFHADVIKRAQQNILTIKDHFSSYQDAILIESEKAIDLKNGIISLTSSMRRPSGIYVSVDNSPGFKNLLSNNDDDLKKLNIQMIKTDELNKNSNAVIDRGCQELEDELKRLEPEGAKINISILKLAILNLNSKLRRRGNISAYEINTARDQVTGDNLNLDDKKIREDQLQKRKENVKEALINEVEVGDTVKIKNTRDKHKANEMFIVTTKNKENVGVQKLLHPLRSTPGKIMSKVYNTNQKHLIAIHHPVHPNQDDPYIDNFDEEIIPIKEKKEIPFNPFNSQFYHDDDDDDVDDEKDIVKSSIFSVKNSPIHPLEADPELEWDDSPEQYAIQQFSSDNEVLNNAIKPRTLFQADDNHDDISLTSEDSNDEVFHGFRTPPSSPKLKRNNAIRLKQNPLLQSLSEPRITRLMLHSNRLSVSNPNSPSSVALDRVQNLENILNPNAPLVPEAVNLGPRVQNFNQALANVEIRRSSRIRSNIDSKGKVDYRQLHEHGKRD